VSGAGVEGESDTGAGVGADSGLGLTRPARIRQTTLDPGHGATEEAVLSTASIGFEQIVTASQVVSCDVCQSSVTSEHRA